MPIHKNTLNLYRRYDEYYTRYEHVKHIFEDLIPKGYLKDKIIYLPCDSEESNFTIYMKEYKEELGYKELIYTWDDYNTHMDLFMKCDIVVTNPPFSKLIKEFIPILNECGKQFFILGSKISLNGYFKNFKCNNDIRYYSYRNRRYNFICLDESLKNDVAYIYISNIPGIIYNWRTDLWTKPELSIVYGKDKNGNIYRNYDKLANVPEDEYDEILVPVTILFEHNRKYYDVKSRAYIKEYSDGKMRYARMLVKKKPCCTA